MDAAPLASVGPTPVALGSATCAGAAAAALVATDPDAWLRAAFGAEPGMLASFPLALLAAAAAAPFGFRSGRRHGSGAAPAAAWFAAAWGVTAALAPTRLGPSDPSDPHSALLLADGGLAGAALAGWAGALGRPPRPVGVAARVGLAIGAVHATAWATFLLLFVGLELVLDLDLWTEIAITRAVTPVALAATAGVAVAATGPPAPRAQGVAALGAPLGLLLALGAAPGEVAAALARAPAEARIGLPLLLAGTSLAAVALRARATVDP